MVFTFQNLYEVFSKMIKLCFLQYQMPYGQHWANNSASYWSVSQFISARLKYVDKYVDRYVDKYIDKFKKCLVFPIKSWLVTVTRISAVLFFNILNMNVLKFISLNFTALTHIFVTCSGSERLRQNQDLRQNRQCNMTWGSLSLQTLAGSGFPSFHKPLTPEPCHPEFRQPRFHRLWSDTSSVGGRGIPLSCAGTFLSVVSIFPVAGETFN